MLRPMWPDQVRVALGRLSPEVFLSRYSDRYVFWHQANQAVPATGRVLVFEKMFETGKSAEEIIASEGLAQISDAGSIETVARQVVTKSPENVAKYKSGNEGVFKFFVGQVMKETRGQANPQIVNEILKRVLAEA